MENFKYKNPTKILFGKGQIENLGKEIPKDAKILMLYGGGSIKENGIYEQVVNAIGNREFIEFGGIPANPEYDVLIDAVEVIKKEDINYILAVGGGSVIDGAKFVSAAAAYKGDEPWNILSKAEKIDDAVPFSTVLTLPATGSEMNSGAVISRRSTKEKLSFGSPLLYPKCSVLDPTVIHSLPKKQIVNGVVDAYNHVLEQYLTYPTGALLQDRFAESILQTLIEVGKDVVDDPTDYKAASNFMWSCTMALNGLISQGVPTDWGVHGIGHELTALYGIDHARTLAIIGPRYYEHNFETKKDKLVQYGKRVWNLGGDNEDIAKQAIKKTEEFYNSLDVKTKLSEYTEEYNDAAEIISKRFIERGWKGIGEKQHVTPDDVKKIVESAY